MIDQDRSIGSYRPRQTEINLVKSLPKSGFEEVFHEGHFYLFKKTEVSNL